MLNLLLIVIQYLVFSIFLFSGTLVFYSTLTSKEERKVHRLKLVEGIRKSKDLTREKVKNNSFDKRLIDAGITYLSSFRYEIIRFFILMLFVLHYIVYPVYQGHSITTSVLAVLGILILITEHRIKFPLSLINSLLNLLIERKRRKKAVELFTLYDILKSDLKALNSNQEVNVYSILRDALPMFQHIDGTISRFLSLWVTNPEKAKVVFYEDIQTQGAKTIGEVIVKIDTASKSEAIDVIQNESSVYANHYFKDEVLRNSKRKNLLTTTFAINVLVNATWLIVLIATMVMLQLDNDMIM